MEYHIAKTGKDTNRGTADSPFRTIQHGADVAVPGDIITVHEGVYREKVDPPRGGDSDEKRIIFRAADGEAVSIKGSEVIRDWKKLDGGVWMVTLPNDYFGSFNPYANILSGDWMFPRGMVHHTGALFINDRALNEAPALEDLFDSLCRKWFGKSDSEFTRIWVNCGDLNPNEELTEINVRQSVIYPSNPGINYITVQGFSLSQAATPWSPPTTEQIGLIGTNWSKGWIIEQNTVTHSRCTGITLGKYFDREDGLIEFGFNAHFQTVKRILERGDWTKENVGGHIVRYNRIAHCEQSGIVGSHGAAFSEIYGNHIHHIHRRLLFGGFEQAGIKFHAPVDTIIRENLIHDCWMGIWLDWMDQGARVSKNVFFNNDSWGDLFLEISHGPVLVDNNIMMSRRSIYDSAQGNAFVHNLFGGEIEQREEEQRTTQYFQPHSTVLAGVSKVTDGDERFYNNIVMGDRGLAPYDNTEEEVVIEGNVYLYRAKPASLDSKAVCFPDADIRYRITVDDEDVYLELPLETEWGVSGGSGLIDTKRLGKTKISNQGFENPDGSSLRIDCDINNSPRALNKPFPGPIELSESVSKIKIWSTRAGALSRGKFFDGNDAFETEDR